MTRNDIKKELYKQKPTAELLYIRGGVAHYSSKIGIDGERKTIFFEVPVSDMGESDFTPKMSAQLLIRWLRDDVSMQ